jgi:hypothetical protein
MVAPGYRVTLERMRMPYFSLIERAWSALRTFGPHLAMVLLPGGLLILCVLLVVERRNAISFSGYDIGRHTRWRHNANRVNGKE